MSNTLAELLEQRASLEAEIARLRKAERDEVIANVRALIRDYDLTLIELGTVLRTRPQRKPAGSAPAKYRDPATGDRWSGRGLMPKWLRAHVQEGRGKETFAV